MSAADDYMDRLRNIREKYGCMHARKQTSYMERPSSAINSTSSLRTSTNFERSTNKPSTNSNTAVASLIGKKDLDSYAMSRLPQESNYSRYGDYEKFDRKKRTDQYSIKQPVLSTSINHRISFGNSADNYSKKDDRDKQIQRIRQTYAANRRRVMEDFQYKYSENQYARGGPSYGQTQHKITTTISKDLYKPKDYSITDEYKPKSYGHFDLESRQRPNSKAHYLPEQSSLSPIKRMTEYIGDTTRKSTQLENVAPISMSPARPKETTESFWRERQNKLSELTSNKLNQYRLNSVADEWGKQKRSKTGIYHQQTRKTSLQESPTRRTKRFTDLENRGEQYNVTNIQKIQQRIQSILGKN